MLVPWAIAHLIVHGQWRHVVLRPHDTIKLGASAKDERSESQFPAVSPLLLPAPFSCD